MQQYRYYLALILIGIFSLLCYFSYIKIHDRQKFNSMPQFEFISITNNIYSHKDFLTRKRPVAIIYFNSDCDFCKHEINEIQTKIELFSDIDFVLVSSQTAYELNAFFQNTTFRNYQNVKICVCDGLKLYDWFGNLVAPTTMIYSKDGDLIRKFSGATAIEEILKVLNNVK